MSELDNNQKILIEKALEFHKTGKIKDAINLYLKIIGNNENNSQLLFLLGTAQVQLGEMNNGVKNLKKSLSIKPDNASAHSNLGNAFKALNRLEDALNSYNKAIEINANFSDAYSNRGIILQELKRFDEALESYNKAIQIKPNHFFAHSNKGITLKELNRYEEALASYDKAIEINPKFIEPYNNKGNVLKDLKRYAEALENFKKVMELKIDFDYALGKVLHYSMFLCDWANFDNLSKKINESINRNIKVIEPFSFLGISDNPSHAKLNSEIFVKNSLSLSSEIEPLNKKYNHKKTRIAYFSGDFHDHPVLHLMMDVFKNHDKSKFDLFGFSYGPNKEDKWRKEVEGYFDQFININKISDKEAVHKARNLELDIVINLSGLTGKPRHGIFSYRAAPIQINYLGYPGTTGAEYMDYLIADETIVPTQDFKYYTEKVLHLPNCYQANMKSRNIAKQDFNRSDFGLPKDAFVYCNFNNNYKITPYIYDVWMNILKSVKNSVLWILKPNDKAIENLKKETENRGVESSRIIFAKKLPNDQHLKRINLADLFIDTFPYNAHTTASDAVRMGVPIVTLKGNTFHSRVCASILNSLSMKDLITYNKKDYQELAIELGKNPEKLKQIKTLLQNSVKNASLFDSINFTKNLEVLYLGLLKN